MPRYKSILAARIEEEQKEALKQEELKEKNGITEGDVVVKKKTASHFLRAVLFTILTIIRFTLCAIGILVLIEPTIRATFFNAILRLVGGFL